jgi:hypothetical protein
VPTKPKLLPVNAIWQQVCYWYCEDACEHDQLKVSYPTRAAFDRCYNVSGYVPTKSLAFRRQSRLGPSSIVAKFPYLRSDNIPMTVGCVGNHTLF